MIKLIDENIIQDFNIEGLENVESEDFDPGYGCVVEKKPIEILPVPDRPVSKEEEEMWLANQHFQTEREREFIEDQFLSAHGVDINPRQK